MLKREEIARLKEKYPKGTPIRLYNMEGETSVPPGSKGIVATGLDTYLGVDPYVSGSTEVASLLTEGVRDWVEAAYTVEKDIDKLGDLMIARIEEKRDALGI